MLTPPQPYTDTLFELSNGYFIYVEVDAPIGWRYTLYNASGTALSGGDIYGFITDPFDIVCTAQCAEDMDDASVRVTPVTLEELLARKKRPDDSDFL